VREKRATWIGAYDHIRVPVRAEWDAFEVSLREIVHLQVGDVLELPATLLQQTQLLLNGTPKFVGTVGLDGEHAAVQLTRKLTHPSVEMTTPHAHGRKDP
jgi:flagellar motor switch protein FliM